MDRLAGPEFKITLARLHDLVRLGHQVHFDAMLLRVPNSAMIEGIGIEIGAEHTVDVYKHVLVESCCHAAPIIIRTDQCLGLLYQVDADEELAVFAKRLL